MLTKERHEKILAILHEQNAVTVAQLEKMFGVSGETVRRDLLALEGQKQLIRVHGGAMSIEKTIQSKDFAVRHTEYCKEKQSLSRLAMNFVHEGDIIGIDSGSTAVFFCQQLIKYFEHLTVVTCSQMLFDILSQNRGFHIILCGGEYHQTLQGFYGHLTLQMLRSLHVTKAFLAPAGLSLSVGATVFESESVPVQQEFQAIADKVFLIADSSKFNINATYCSIALDEDITVLTDHGLDDAVYQHYLDANIDIIRGETSI